MTNMTIIIGGYSTHIEFYMAWFDGIEWFLFVCESVVNSDAHGNVESSYDDNNLYSVQLLAVLASQT